MADRAPIFIVGLPRSGTTLLAALLSAHPEIDCGPETWFFRRLPAETAPLVDPSRWPGPATDFLCSLRIGRDPPVHEQYGLTREEIEGALTSRSPSVASILESLTETHAQAAGKPRWAEKSPRHIQEMPRIRAAFPDAAIVRIVRDPRDAALSRARTPFGGDSLVANLYFCAGLARESERWVGREPRLLTTRFEALVRDPGSELRRICEFVGEPFDPAMLARDRRTAVVAPHEWWKEKVTQAVDASRAEVWRHELGEADQRAAAVICHDVLERHGYPGGIPPRKVIAFEPDGLAFARRRDETALRLARSGIVLGRARSRRGSAPPVLAFWSRDGADPWRLGRRGPGRVRRLARMAYLLVRARMARSAAVWVREAQGSHGTDRSGATRLANAMLRVLAHRMSAEEWLRSLRVEDGPATAESHAAGDPR